MSALDCENIKDDDPVMERQNRLNCYEKPNQKLLEYTTEAIRQTLFTDHNLLGGIVEKKNRKNMKNYISDFKSKFKVTYLPTDEKYKKDSSYNIEKKSENIIINTYIKKSDDGSYTIQKSPDHWDYLLKRIIELLNDPYLYTYENSRESILRNIAKIILLFLFQARILEIDIVKFENLAKRLNDIFMQFVKSNVESNGTFNDKKANVKERLELEPLELERFEPYFVIKLHYTDNYNIPSTFYRGIIEVLKLKLKDIDLTGEELEMFNKEHGIAARYDLGAANNPVEYSTGVQSKETYKNDEPFERFGEEEEERLKAEAEAATLELEAEAAILEEEEKRKENEFEGFGNEGFEPNGGTRKRKHFRRGKHFSKKHFSKKCHKTLLRKGKKTMKRKYKKTVKRKSKKTLKRKHVRRRTSSTV